MVGGLTAAVPSLIQFLRGPENPGPSIFIATAYSVQAEMRAVNAQQRMHQLLPHERRHRRAVLIREFLWHSRFAQFIIGVYGAQRDQIHRNLAGDVPRLLSHSK